MTTPLSGRAAIFAIGLLAGLAGLSLAGPARAQADNAAATAQTSPADAQAAPANAAAATDAASDAARQDDVKQPVIVTQQQADQPVARANPVAAGNQNPSSDETTLIGKIFIGFGALLTVASAARMFMA